MSSPSLALAAWAGSWLSGSSAPDDVVDALHEWAPMHVVIPRDDEAADFVGVRTHAVGEGVTLLLTAMRRLHNGGSRGIRPVLPAPGDARGLPAGSVFAAEALAADNAVVAGAPGSAGLGFVPVREGPEVLRWSVFALASVPAPAESSGLGEAEFSMKEAVREAAAALVSIPTVGSRGDTDPREDIARLIAEAARHRYPSNLPPRAARILDSADRVAAILTVAGRGGGLQVGSAAGATNRESALAPLWAAVRSARVAAVTASFDVPAG